MIERLQGEGQGCCEVCKITKGFHREWTTSLYHVKNAKGLILRRDDWGNTSFSNNEEWKPIALCYKHAFMTDDCRKSGTDYTKAE